MIITTDTATRAQELLDQIIDNYVTREEIWTKGALSEMIDEALLHFDKDMADTISSLINDTLMDSFTKSLPDVLPNYVDLSDMLWRNSVATGNDVLALLESSYRYDDTWESISRTLLDGYDPKQDTLRLIDDKMFPKYWEDMFDDDDIEKFAEHVKDLQSSPYKTALEELVRDFKKMDIDQINDALDVALKEKARFYADRIAKTEITRAKNLAQAQDMMSDKDIKLVRWELSSRHKIFDICDYYAKLDIGYGAGIFPKSYYPSIPLHPFCQCKVVPYYHKIKKKRIKDPTKKLFKDLTPHQQRDILGSWDNLNDYHNGVPITQIFNKSRPKYPIIPMKDVLDDLKKIPPLEKIIPPFAPPIDYDVKVDLGHGPIYNKFVNMDNVRSDAQDIMNKYPKPREIGPYGSSSSPAYYSPDLYDYVGDGSLGEIVLRPNTFKNEQIVFLHEYGHHIDYITKSKGDGWLFRLTDEVFWDDAMEMDMEFLDDLFGDSSKVLSGMKEELFSRGQENFSGMSDIMDALSGGVFRDNYGMSGHGVNYFLSDTSKKAEIFAQLWEAWSRQSPAWDFALEYYPTLSDAFLRTIREL